MKEFIKLFLEVMAFLVILFLSMFACGIAGILILS